MLVPNVTRCGRGTDGGELLPWVPPDCTPGWSLGLEPVALFFSLAPSSPRQPVPGRRFWPVSGCGFGCSLQFGRICILSVPLGKVETSLRLSFQAGRLMLPWNMANGRGVCSLMGTNTVDPTEAFEVFHPEELGALLVVWLWVTILRGFWNRIFLIHVLAFIEFL